MKRSLFILLVAATACGCQAPRGAESDIAPVGRPVSGYARPAIGIGPNEKVLMIVSANLDSDPDVEQVIAVKSLEDISSPVKIMVADSNSAKGRYFFKSWESEASSISARVFELSLKDLVGDHAMEIIFRGMDVRGKTTLDVFKKAPALSTPNVVYSLVGRIKADDIIIEECERPKSYSLGQKNGDSFTIAAYVRDAESKDMIRTVHSWDYGENRYVAGAPEKILREKLEKNRMVALYADPDIEGFEEFIEGSWILFGTPKSSGDKPRTLQIITLDRKLRRISRYLGDTEEIYDWNESMRVGGDRLLAYCKNIDVHTISRTFHFHAVSVDSLEITVSGTDLGDADSIVFTRITTDMPADFIRNGYSSPSIAASVLDGDYRSASGDSISFDSSRFLWNSGQEKFFGAYLVFPFVGRRVMSIRFLNENGMSLGVKNYLFEAASGVQRIVLTPIRLTVSGYETASGEQIVLERENLPAG